jgi:type I restriction enzyme S subunit
MSKIPEGYKQTEVGVIPEDWEEGNLGELSIKVGSGITPTGGERVYKSEGRPFLRSQNVGWGKLILDDIAFIDDKTHETFVATEIEVDDVFLNITGASIGRSAIADNRVVGGNVNQHVCIIRTQKSKLTPHFLVYFLLSKNGQKQIDSFQTGGNRQGLNFGQIKSFQIPLPPTITEQTAIATVLSDVDTLIQSLEKLIAKKRAIKQGTMQELLKPKEGWVVKKLGELFEFSGGFSASRAHLSEEGYCYLHYGDIHGATNTYIDVIHEFTNIPKLQTELKKIARNSMLNDGDVVFVDASEDDEGASRHIVVVNPNEIPFISGLHTIVAKSKNNEINDEYKRYCFQSTNIKSQFKFFAVGTKVSGISKTNIVKIEIYLPSIEEQIRIATILSDMDTEINALESKLAKYKQIKQGMMQNLLTGRIRLI